MTIEVRTQDGTTAAFTPVAGPDGDAGLADRCALSCRLHNRDNPGDPWILHVDGAPQATDDVSQAWVAKQAPAAPAQGA